MVLNEALVDWLTLTTFDATHWKLWMGEVFGTAQKVTESRRLQYRGMQSGGLFVGEAQQNNRPHYMAQVSGEASDRFARTQGHSDDVNCTRIDLQITIELPDAWDSRQTYDDITTWETDGRKRQTSIVQSGDGCDTIYIGSRTSDRFTRLYVKPLTDGHALRFEVEFKGDHAKSIWRAIATRTGTARDFLIGELKAMPDTQNGTFKRFLDVLGYTGMRSRPKRAYADSGTLRWIRDQVDPAIHRAMNDHEHGPLVRKIIKAWAAEAEQIDADDRTS